MEHQKLKIDSNIMQCISMNRSKCWATIFEKYGQGDEDEVIDIDKLPEIFKDEVVQSDASNSEAEEADPVECEDLNFTSWNITKRSNARGILAQVNKKINETGIIDREMQELIEETLPIVEEYRRISRDAGFDAVFRTFDLEKIEEKIADWTRENNSITSQSFSSPDDFRGREFFRKEKHFCRNKQRNHFYESDSESLHSVDTGSYIRSSRVHKHIATTLTTIKSYRLVESKRNKLRCKYAYLMVDDDDTMQMFKKERCRQPTFKYQSAKKNATDIHRIDKNIRRIPRHRRRRNQIRNTSYSSSEEESVERDKNLKSLSCECEFHCSGIPSSKGVRKNHYANDYDVGRLPYMHESECTCNGADKLCKNFRHLANSSAEEWIVENCERPLETASSQHIKNVKEAPKTTKMNISERPLETASSQHIKNAKEAPTKAKMNISDNISSGRRNNTKNKSEPKTKKGQTKEKRVTNDKNNGKKSNEQSQDDPEDTFEQQLQMALKLSKEEYEKNLMKNKNTKKIDSFNSNFKGAQKNYDKENVELSHTDSILSTQLEADLKIVDSLDKNQSVNSMFKIEHERCKITNNTKIRSAKISSETKTDIKDNINSKKIPKIMKPLVVDKKFHKKTSALKCIAEEKDASPIGTQKIKLNDPDSSSNLKIPINLTLNSTDYTSLFANSGNLCNSTALANTTANSRQLLKKPSIQKPIIVSENKIEKFKANESKFKLQYIKELQPSIPLNDPPVQSNNNIVLSDSDTEIISSTTDDIQIPKVSSQKCSKKDDNRIMLYSPTNPLLIPSHRLTNGKFKLTEAHLSSVLGNKMASKFMKYYMGPKTFKGSSTVYYIPPKPDAEINSSDSEVDYLNLCSQYGTVIEE